ncbi:UDP-N-acetylmuramoyl-tripeptide--D-alanyl-D-alanine ligase [Algicola sagamiensis]|uniref:UDP-N-acetylmuramoyl-tripeptide--D-alanyl-D- alanine ligase n=1 Tax=Algicola sagamiensis TaxID=163869 RepID=UPI0003632A46|nr:UDP-N-acetylmuramoyl-tripeptide--D-alanyl-D-alanine ligase [Algicola sagamiensis]
MIKTTLDWIANAVHGKLMGPSLKVSSVSTDTRTIVDGDLFIALKGPNFDAHDFIETAIDAGATALIVERYVRRKVPQILVKDTRIALGELAAAVKQKVAPKTVAITGSTGKTSVKEMVSSILSQKGNVLATKGNFNNDIGVPLTLLRLESQHKFAVVELGANHIGEIGYTSNLVKPDVAVINNVSGAHLEGFGDIYGVVRAKGEIFKGLASDGVAVINQSCEYFPEWEKRLQGQKEISYGYSGTENVWAQDVQLHGDGLPEFTLWVKNNDGSSHNVRLTLPLPGQHNVSNALAASAICLAFGLMLEEIAEGLQQLNPVKGRVNVLPVKPGLTLIDDTYNANVASLRAGIDLLSSFEGKRILVFGDMGELGEQARSCHEQVGQYAQESGIDNLLTLGVLSQSASEVFQENGEHFSSRDRLIETLDHLIQQTDEPVTVLVKGSRSAKMELVVNRMIELSKQPGVVE